MHLSFNRARSFATYANAVKKARELPTSCRWIVGAREDGRFVVIVLLGADNTIPLRALCDNGFCVAN